jgi:hypothetical protein
LAFGSLWAGGLMMLGLLLWSMPPDLHALTQIMPDPLRRGIALLAVAGAQFIFMVLVADQVCHRTPLLLKAACKLVAAAATWAALVWTLWLVFSAINA